MLIILKPFLELLTNRLLLNKRDDIFVQFFLGKVEFGWNIKC